MCEDPRVEESTLTVADTPAVRQVLARWLAHPDDVAPEVYVARGLAAAGYEATPYAPGVYAVTPRFCQPDGYMFGQLWQVFRHWPRTWWPPVPVGSPRMSSGATAIAGKRSAGWCWTGRAIVGTRHRMARSSIPTRVCTSSRW